MKITKQGLKKIIKEELIKETNGLSGEEFEEEQFKGEKKDPDIYPRPEHPYPFLESLFDPNFEMTPLLVDHIYNLIRHLREKKRFTPDDWGLKDSLELAKIEFWVWWKSRNKLTK